MSMEKPKEVFTPNAINNNSIFDLAKDKLNEVLKDIIKSPLKVSENKYELIELKKVKDPFDLFLDSVKNNKTFPVDSKTSNRTETLNYVPIKTFPSAFLTVTNFINDNKIKISIFAIILVLFIIACFNKEFATTIKNLLSNKDNKASEISEISENNEKIDKITEALTEDLNKPVAVKRKIFSENLTNERIGLNNTLSPTNQVYLDSLYTSLKRLNEKEKELLILKEFNSRRTGNSEEEKIEIQIHNERFVDQLKIVKHNRYYYNHQIQVILNSNLKEKEK